MKVEDGEPVRFGYLIDIVGGQETGGSGHVLDDYDGVSGNMLAQMAGDETRIAIKTAVSRKTDN
jgi:hypothetical protein